MYKPVFPGHASSLVLCTHCTISFPWHKVQLDHQPAEGAPELGGVHFQDISREKLDIINDAFIVGCKSVNDTFHALAMLTIWKPALRLQQTNQHSVGHAAAITLPGPCLCL